MDFPDPNRRTKAVDQRNQATALSTAVPHPAQKANNDKDAPYIFRFTKGLLHLDNGLLDDPADFEAFVAGTITPNPEIFAQAHLNTNVAEFHGAEQADFDALTCKPDKTVYRQWESPTAGHAYVLEGLDPFALTMPPAPSAGSFEFSAEMGEVYQMALSRDWPVAGFMDRSLVDNLVKVGGANISNAARTRLQTAQGRVADAAVRLSGMKWFDGQANGRDTPSTEHRARRRFGTTQTASNMFRGIGEDPWNTPFLSQFMVMGDGGCGRETVARASGVINFGAQRIDQKVRIATPNQDYMTTWHDWLDVQNALNARPLEPDEYIKADGAIQYRCMTSLRDMATYVHDDQLYQAYLNAALIMLSEKYDFDPGLPYHDASANTAPGWNREPFALFGGPHLLTLLTEVSSRALKAVRLQKFSVHRRMRPEAAAALFHTIYSGYNPNRENGGMPYAQGDGSAEAKARSQLGNTLAGYTFPTGSGTDPVLEDILTDIRLHNAANNGEAVKDKNIAKWLLPMAFPEGSPMHPAYGAGHATVAGACVTLLKAFFNMRDTDDPLHKPAYLVRPGDTALVPDCGTNVADDTIDLLGVPIADGLTLEGELNKLIWNISNARNVAGVHYNTDYIESALLGEDITLGILREQMLCYETDENVTLTVPLLVARTLPPVLLNGSSIDPDDMVEAVCITNTGILKAVPALPKK